MLLLLSFHINFFLSSTVYRIVCECIASQNRQTRYTIKTSIMPHITPPLQAVGCRVTTYGTLLSTTILSPYQYSLDMRRPLFKLHHKYVYTTLSNHSLKLLTLFLTNHNSWLFNFLYKPPSPFFLQLTTFILLEPSCA
jgi:hypothetical protein